MSRLAKKPIRLQESVTVKEESGMLLIKGPKGELGVRVLPFLSFGIKDGSVDVSPVNQIRQSRANAGTMWSLIKNAAEGVAAGFSKTLEIEGIGYRASVEGNALILALGYVQPVRVEIPEGIAIKTEKNMIHISGIDKRLVGETAARIRRLKKPEPYKGKGIRYQGEVVRRKAGKKAAAAA
ncbi:MAG: 50S ribosomal protein L6 [Candidatus Liptonbacteria bacterium]|nr:50S ribosomal protein L6 [Candidatus Liptonbacteria bacterium]